MSHLIALPRYNSRKFIQALKIKHVIPNPRGHELHFENDRYAPVEVTNDWVQSRKPLPGGYFVLHIDGYPTYMTGEAFESQYELAEKQPLTLDQQYDIDANADKIHQLAGLIWDALNQIDPDPMHPQFEHFEDPIKDVVIGAAVALLTACKQPLLAAGQTGGHTVECLYGYTLARLGLTDTPEMRVLFWDAIGVLEWDDQKDQYITPELSGQKACSCQQAKIAEPSPELGGEENV